MLGGFLLGLALAAGYVAPLHLVSSSRDDSRTIKARMACILACCCLSWIPVVLYVKPQGPGGLLRTMGLAGGQRGVLAACLVPLATTAVLFLGPLATEMYDIAEGRPRRRYSVPPWRSAAAWRDLVFGPLSEELVFRVLLLAVLRKAGLPPGAAVLTAPLFFGVAHLHHFQDHIRHKGWPVSRALHAVAAQFLYTTAFGWLVSWFYIKFDHLLACALPHMFCNWMGFPDFPGMQRHEHSNVILRWLFAGIVLSVVMVVMEVFLR